MGWKGELGFTSQNFSTKPIIAWVISTVLRNTESSLPSVETLDWGLGTKRGAGTACCH